MAESGSLTVYPSTYIGGSAYNYQNTSYPIGKGSSNTTYARFGFRSNKPVSIYYGFDLSEIPENAEIQSVKVVGLFLDYFGDGFTVSLCSGTTKKATSSGAISSLKQTVTVSGVFTRAELNDARLLLSASADSSSTRYLYFYGADLTVTYTVNSEKFMLKLGGSWTDVARVFKKVNGIWVEQTDLANVIEDGVRYKNGGEYVKPATFVVDGVEYTMEEGMTWAEWIASGYNTAGFYLSSNYAYSPNGKRVQYYPYGTAGDTNIAVATLVISDGNGGNYFTE